ncbi:hypothetical protein PENSPDRAFT_608515 [Peniophora sp. CONT]|nr:hypothetical protein PENSPDRAFT_608515 [Peniophora sp. CONT]
MAESAVPTEVLDSERFLMLAGSILFRNVHPSPSNEPLEVCLIWHTVRKEWLLPKGRKDRGEDLQVTAARETYEETGYPCELLPLNMTTRAPAPGVHTKDNIQTVEACLEPFTITIRHAEPDEVKITSWFASVATGERQDGTQMSTEQYTSSFFPADEALERAAYRDDRAIIARAIQLVRETYRGATEA